MSPVLNFKASSLRDNDLHTGRCRCLRCAAALTLALLLSTAAKGQFGPVLLVWVLSAAKGCAATCTSASCAVEAILQQLTFKR